MFVPWVVFTFLLGTCWNTSLSANDDYVGRFTAFHSQYGAHLGLEEGVIFEEYAKELFFEHQRFEMNGGLDAQFLPQNIPNYWVHAVLVGELPPILVQQVVTFLREGKPTTTEEAIAAFILLDKMNLKETVVDIWSNQNPQMQFDVFGRLVGKGTRYAEFAPRIANSVDHDTQVGWQVSPDSGYSLSLRFVVECYLLDLIRADPVKYKKLETLISTRYLNNVAKAACNTIGYDTLAAIHQEFLTGKHDEHLGCSFRFEFALTEEFARHLLRVEFSECRVDRYRGLRTIWRRYPEIANQFLAMLAASDKQEDLRVVLKFFEGPIFRSLDDRPMVVKALTQHLKSTNAEFLAGRGDWSITCAAFSKSDQGVEVPIEVKRNLAADTVSKLDSICEIINRRCSRTFFAKSLEEAILSMKSNER